MFQLLGHLQHFLEPIYVVVFNNDHISKMWLCCTCESHHLKARVIRSTKFRKTKILLCWESCQSSATYDLWLKAQSWSLNFKIFKKSFNNLRSKHLWKVFWKFPSRNLNKHTSEFRHKMKKKLSSTCLYWNAFKDNFWLRSIRGQGGTIDLTTFGIAAHIV